MTITGQINGTYSGYANRYAVRLYYSYDQNQLDNYSTVSAYLQIRSINSPQYGAYSNLGSASIAFGGYTASASNITYDFRDYDWHTVISMTNKRVNHNTDGTKDLYFSASFATNDSDISSIITASASGTVPLQSILRASTFGALADFYIESPFGFAINKYIEDTPDTLTIAFDTFSKAVSDYTSGEDIEFTLAELNALYALTTAQNSIPFTLTITTGEYGSNTATVNGYITVMNPTFSGTITPTPNYAINGQTSVSVVLSTGAVAYKDATISEYIVSIGTQTLRSNTYANPFVFSNVDGNTITVNVVDSRGNSLASPQTQSITLHPYAKPTIVTNIQRTPTMADDTVSFAVSGVFSVVPNQTNPIVSYRYRESGSTWGASTTVTATYGTGTYSYTATLVATFDVDKSYEFEITVTDAYTTTVMSVTLFSAQPTMDIDTARQRVAIGKFLDTEPDKSVSIAGKLYVSDDASVGNDLSVAGSILEGGIPLSTKYGKGRFATLWTGSASTFGAQSIQLSESVNNFDFLICSASYWGTGTETWVLMPTSGNTSITVPDLNTTGAYAKRTATVSDDMITWTNGRWTNLGNTDNSSSACIPHAIYGVKI